jgi:hypothetical protein
MLRLGRGDSFFALPCLRRKFKQSRGYGRMLIPARSMLVHILGSPEEIWTLREAVGCSLVPGGMVGNSREARECFSCEDA